MDDKKQLIINISNKTIFKIVLFGLILFFLYLIRDVAFILIISIIFASIMIPLVDFLGKKKIPRTISVIGIYLIFLLLIALAIYLVIPIVSTQIGSLALNLSNFSNRFLNGLGNRFGFQSKDIAVYIQKALESFSSGFSSFTQNIYSTTVKIIGEIATAIMVIVLSFYLTIEKNFAKKLIEFFTPKNKQEQWVKLITKAQKKMAVWLSGQIIMSFLVFVLSFIVFLILGIHDAFTLALIMGLLEIVPYFGPLIGGAAAALVAFSQSFFLGIIVILAIILIQQVENHILTPNVMKKVTGLSPVVIILAILIGIELFGFIGIIIAIPTAVAISVILQESVAMNEHKGNLIYKSKIKG
jgi:predicted PurR-regulated permease PerM